MNMHSYSEALSKLPAEYKVQHYDKTHEVMFGGRLVLATAGQKPLVYEDGKWKEFVYENTIS